MFLFGAIAAAFYGTNDISEVMMKQGLIGLAVLVLGLNIWTTNDNALYAASLGFATLARWPKRRFVLLTVSSHAVRHYLQPYVPWLNLLNRNCRPSRGADSGLFRVRRDAEHPQIRGRFTGPPSSPGPRFRRRPVPAGHRPP
jgi:cytosine permease